MKIGILSFAHHHSEAYIANLRSLPDVTLMGVADEEAVRGRHFAGQYQTRFYPTYEDLIEERQEVGGQLLHFHRLVMPIFILLDNDKIDHPHDLVFDQLEQLRQDLAFELIGFEIKS